MSDPSPAESYDYDLPAELIAQDPPDRRGDSRLLLVEPGDRVVGERVFRQLPEVLRAGDLLVLNESRVLPARLLTVREDTGGRVEILLVRPVAADNTWLALARPGRRLRTGTRLLLGAGSAHDAPVLEISERLDQGQVLVTARRDPGLLAEQWGVMPLPPYIKRGHEDLVSERGRRDRDRYQTVFAVPDDKGAGSVAAPTAGLHFSDAILGELANAGIETARVSLHVGPGTFREPTVEQFAARRLHREYFHLPADTASRIAETRRGGGRVIAVGTTSLRVLETVSRLGLSEDGPDHLNFRSGAGESLREFTGEAMRRDGHWEVVGQTRLFLRPPDKVSSVDGLLTNFHLPGSSLLMLVAALAGEKTWQLVYAHAVAERMRFYSYGDCMLILPGVSGCSG
ncbi:MAG: tRNA preQ1(34) S-adenosylmethionine ribosyltransferase-isomerase QueA [Candidatus Krumholzibacteria bacterium]|nr:tRNA preQ1(34) S-adenosylmethionine ribosyltransferase-isomerase QueA [Candidatus Krumholzibacteria bacterium]